MAVTTWTAGQVLAAADLNDTFASKVDYALPTNAQTGTAYTFVAADAEKLTTASNGSAVTLTIPPASSVAWPDNTVLRVVNYGAGAVTIDGGSGVTVTNTSSTIAQYGAAVAIRTGSDAWTVVPFGGGDIPAAEVSSPAATGQYTDSGTTYDYYTFTASGTLTVDTAGFADVLVIGGGGGGGRNVGGGGGGGGALVQSDVYLPAGSLTVTVGAGGLGTTNDSARKGYNGATSRLGDLYFGVGGGGGAGSTEVGVIGGSGGGGGLLSAVGGSGLSTQGNNGGTGVGTTATGGGGGGGGAGAVGSNASVSTGGAGGAGSASDITGSSVTRAGGGGGGGTGTGGAAGSGGGGAGGTSGVGSNGSVNTGGGGGGSHTNNGGNGGSGVVIVRVKV